MPNPFPSTTSEAGILGCGEYVVYLGCRGGGELMELPFTDLSYSRKVDDMSDATLRLGHYDNDRSYIAPPALTEECCGVLAIINPWQHELVVHRDGEEVWVGPIIKTTHAIDSTGNGTITIYARDLFQWFERRLLPTDRDFYADLADIFQQLASDALHRDPIPHINFQATPTGIIGERTVLFDAYRRAADEMRELLRSGLDMTMIGRTMILGGVEVPTAELGRLITEHFDGIEITSDGLQTETESTVIGSSTDSLLGPIAATVGAPIVNGVRTVDPVRGLVQGVVTESGIEDEVSAAAAAETRHDLLAETPVTMTARLLPNAPVPFSKLIPGARADLRIEALCKSLDDYHRLQSVGVNVNANGVESVGVTFTNLGTVG